MKIYNKHVLPHPDFYIVTFTKNPDKPYLLFIHGGPGFNSGIIEYLIEHHHFFNLLNDNIILYDQRNCGRSKIFPNSVSHQDNINDLHTIICYLTNSVEIKIIGLMGHSYGAKLLFDYYNQFHATVPAIFISMANSILIPRLNNLLFDLLYLKKSSPDQYNKIMQTMDNMNLKKMWELSEKLTYLFQENKDRSYLYWANLDCLDRVTDVQKKINLPMNIEVFISVRKDLYSNESNFQITIDSLSVPHLWVNGFHDFITNSVEGVLLSSKITIFYQSSHYPHIEENDRVSTCINKFLLR